jgi:LPS-assembly protein
MTGKKSQSKVKSFPQSGKSKVKSAIQKSKFLLFTCTFTFCFLPFTIDAYADLGKSQPIILNGDTVEYSTDQKEATATGNVSVIYKGSILTCEKLTVNTQTKDALAEGNTRLDDERGTLQGPKMTYNFETKTGNLIDSQFRANPYFGRAKKVKKVSDIEFIGTDTYLTTCNLDRPHYRFGTGTLDFLRGDKVVARNVLFYIGRLPIFYLPYFKHSLKDPTMHVQVIPGKRKEWGYYVLSAWRYNLTRYVTGRVYLDYRQKLGLSQGFGANYNTRKFGKGDFKFYYTNEKTKEFGEQQREFERYLVRLRHAWKIDPRTNLISEYYKIRDTKRQMGTQFNFLKDYFYREYERDVQPRSYILFNHAFNYASLSAFMQKRVNRWYSHSFKVPDDKLPEITFDLPDYKLGETGFYWKSTSIFSNLANKYTAPSDVHEQVLRFDTYNQLSLPFRALMLSLRPYAGSRETYYSKDNQGRGLGPRTAFYSGIDLGTKFYRVFDVRSNFLGLDLNGIRHIITPNVYYAYIHTPTVPQSKLQVFDDIDTLGPSNKVTLELVNKFQTKRGTSQASVDFATVKVSTDYLFKPKGGTGSAFQDILYDLELAPYSWLRFNADGSYDHFQNSFKQINLDLTASFGNERYFGIGHRLERKAGKELTSEFGWRFNPKWKFKIYERYQFASVKGKGLKEQEYTLSRDFHCWTMDFTYNIDKEKGHTIWWAARLKAFPETEFKLDQSYHPRKPGSQADQSQ